jgi:hypothetical protein
MDRYIIDSNGKEIAATDLLLALMQADDYRHHRVSEPSSYQLHLYDYWEDFYQKLLILADEIKTEKEQG